MRLPSQSGPGRPQQAEEKPRTKLISTYCGAIIEVPEEDDEPVPEFVPQAVEGPEGK
jgi:hypothetical protein